MGLWDLLRLGAFGAFMGFWKWGLEIAYFWALGFGCLKNDVVMLVVVYAVRYGTILASFTTLYIVPNFST